MAHLLLLLYRLRTHRFGAWTLYRWSVTLVWGAVIAILGQWALRGRPALPTWHWVVLGLLLLAGIGLPALGGWAARRGYVDFRPELTGVAPPAQALAPEEKIQLHAAGPFEVDNKVRPFADLLAYWRTFGSREHAVMAIVHASRFLLVGRLPQEQVGMWYIFFRPEDIRRVLPGRVACGARSGPGLRVDYRRTPPVKEGKRLPKPVTATVYLRFANEATRSQVWADLLVEGAHG